MVLVTAGMGFYLGASGWSDWSRLLWTLLGTALAAGGSLALNQYLERDLDACMRRTRSRPLPAGRLQPREALVFGLVTMLGGLLVLACLVNGLSALVTAVTAMSYLFLYTPLKRRTPFCSIVGAIPGALPPVTGWVAARGELSIEAGVLFAILFLWQMPHALAIAWLYREDYARAGIRVLPVANPDAVITVRQVVSNCVALFPVALFPTLIGLTGVVYFFAMFFLGVIFLGCGIDLARSCSPKAARRLVKVSFIYLPIQLALMAFDRLIF
ncbi:MAG: protoheme IX farnesyltransferase [Nitrospinota bacterium]|nr:MAG: protoheme IX farnesyltransferase [Nitrospinota bacterium]